MEAIAASAKTIIQPVDSINFNYSLIPGIGNVDEVFLSAPADQSILSLPADQSVLSGEDDFIGEDQFMNSDMDFMNGEEDFLSSIEEVEFNN